MIVDSASLPPRLDPFELLKEREPYEVYAELRRAGAILRGGVGTWVLPRYSEVASVLRDARVGPFQFREPGDSDAGASADGARSLMQRILVATSGAEHARIRRVLSQALNQRTLGELRSELCLKLDALILQLAEMGQFDAVADLAWPVPVSVLSHLCGVDSGEMREIGAAVLTLSRVFAPVVSQRDLRAADVAVAELRPRLSALLVERRRRPGTDLLSVLAAAEAQGVLSHTECVDNAIFVIFAGLETSLTLIAVGCAALGSHPEQFGLLRRGAVSPDSAVEEFLRYDAPTQITARIVREPLELSGRRLNSGRVLLLLLGCANHDEAQFPEPGRLDLARSPNAHLSFGGGPHYCVGAGLARMEAATLFGRLATHLASLEANGGVEREPTATPRVYTRVPLGARAA